MGRWKIKDTNMIFGRTAQQKADIELQKIKHIYENGIIRFAWYPLRLQNGQYIFLERYWAELDRTRDLNFWTGYSFKLVRKCARKRYNLDDALIVKLKK